MLRLLADENLNHHIVRGLRRRQPTVDIVRVQDVGLTGTDDPTVLAWAAARGRVVITHDVSTMTHFAIQRIEAGEPMPGVFEIPLSAPVGQVIDDLLLLVECSLDGEWEGQVRYLPL